MSMCMVVYDTYILLRKRGTHILDIQHKSQINFSTQYLSIHKFILRFSYSTQEILFTAYFKTYFGLKLTKNGDFTYNGRTDWGIILKTDFEVENESLPR